MGNDSHEQRCHDNGTRVEEQHLGNASVQLPLRVTKTTKRHNTQCHDHAFHKHAHTTPYVNAFVGSRFAPLS